MSNLRHIGGKVQCKQIDEASDLQPCASEHQLFREFCLTLAGHFQNQGPQTGHWILGASGQRRSDSDPARAVVRVYINI